MRKPNAVAITMQADADTAVVGVRRGSATVLRCFFCDWGYTVPTEAAKDVAKAHAVEHRETRP